METVCPRNGTRVPSSAGACTVSTSRPPSPTTTATVVPSGQKDTVVSGTGAVPSTRAPGGRPTTVRATSAVGAPTSVASGGTEGTTPRSATDSTVRTRMFFHSYQFQFQGRVTKVKG